jgi:hypothetical protein
MKIFFQNYDSTTDIIGNWLFALQAYYQPYQVDEDYHCRNVLSSIGEHCMVGCCLSFISIIIKGM